MRALLTIVHMTLHEAMRRRILAAALIGGGAFVALFATGMHFVVAEMRREAGLQAIQARVGINALTLAGLYAANFLVVMTAVLLPVDAISGEIASGVIQTVASKPVRRSTIVLGKWIAYLLLTLAYLVVLAGGVMLVARVMADYALPNPLIGLPLMMLEAAVLVTISIAGGARFSTITNGVIAFALFGLAFIGSWVEQIGTFTNNHAARQVGVVASLIMPTEAMWQLAAHHMQPRVMSELNLSPFSPASVPSVAMVWWAAGYAAVWLAAGMLWLRKRPL